MQGERFSVQACPQTLAWCPHPTENGWQDSIKGQWSCTSLHDPGRENPLNMVCDKELGLWNKTVLSSSLWTGHLTALTLFPCPYDGNIVIGWNELMHGKKDYLRACGVVDSQEVSLAFPVSIENMPFQGWGQGCLAWWKRQSCVSALLDNSKGSPSAPLEALGLPCRAEPFLPTCTPPSHSLPFSGLPWGKQLARVQNSICCFLNYWSLCLSLT